MTDTFEIKDRLWNGAINIKVRLDDGTEEPKEYLLVAPRVSYLPLFYKDIIRYFNNFCVINEPIWLEYNGVPIKWNLPVGVIYDLYHCVASGLSSGSTLHLDLKHNGDWPADIIPVVYKGAVDYDKCLVDNYFNQLKQSNYVLSGNSKLVMNLSKDNSSKIWQAVKDHNLNDFTTVNRKLLPKGSFKRVPVKIYTAESYVVQLPASTDMLLRELLEPYPSIKATIQGINASVLHDVSVEEVWSIFKHLDNFLYIILI